MRRDTAIFVAGGTSLIGRALIDHLRAEGFTHLLGVDDAEPDATDAAAVEAFFVAARPEIVFHCAGRSGGIGLNRAVPVDLMVDNLLSTANILASAHRHGVTKLLYLASSCAYPREAPQPMSVSSLGCGPMEPTSEAYATAKFAGWKLCEAYRRQYGCRFITAFPANGFGPHDDFDSSSGHVIPALMCRAHEAKLRGDGELVVWGTGRPRREFVYARDLARACLFVIENYAGEEPINLGGGIDRSIAEVAQAVADAVGFRGRLRFDSTSPDGAPVKRLDSGPLLAMGWRPVVEFCQALAETYEWFLSQRSDDRDQGSEERDDRGRKTEDRRPKSGDQSDRTRPSALVAVGR